MRTQYDDSLVRVALPSAVRTNGTANGTTVDLGVFGNDFRTVMFVVATGTITDGTHTVSMQDSPDNSAWTAVAANRVQGSLPTIAAADDDTVFSFGYTTGTQQYVRLVVVTAGATVGGVFSAVAILSGGNISPVVRA